jgi:hypothetical protein
MKAYVAWPVRFNFIKGEFHITAKYLGDSSWTLPGITQRLRGLNTRLDLINAEWMPVTFDRGAKVLALALEDSRPSAVNIALANLRLEDYDAWRPHITVPLDLWHTIKSQRLTPAEVIAEVGPLTLYVDKRAVFAWPEVVP